MKSSTKVFALIGALAGAAWLLLHRAEAAEPPEPYTGPLRLVSFSVPDAIVAGEVLNFSIIVQSGQTEDISFYGHFIKSVSTPYSLADRADVHLEAGQKSLISFSIPMLPAAHWAWEWERADPSKGLITVVAHNLETLSHIADWTLKEITVYRA